MSSKTTNEQLAMLRGAAVVPTDADHAMIIATRRVDFDNSDTDGSAHNMWNTMLAATPPAYSEALANLLDGYEAMQAEVTRLEREHRYWLKQAAEYAVELSGLEPHYDLPLRINGVTLDELEVAVRDGYQTSAATQLDMITLVRRLMSGSRSARYEEQPDGTFTAIDPTDRGIGTLRAAHDAVEPDMFWNDADPEKCRHSITEVIDAEWCNGTAEIGDVLEIQCAIGLPNLQVRIVANLNDEDGFDYEIIDAALAKQGEKV